MNICISSFININWKRRIKVIECCRIFMVESKMIQEELDELLETYYNGSFAQLACDYIRFTGMTPQEVELLLEEMGKAKGA